MCALTMNAFSSVLIGWVSFSVEEYCPTESFSPRCSKNDVILMQTATYGRMRIGRCITAEEVSIIGHDSRYFGCSANVLDLLDRKCSGKTECEVRIQDIILERDIRPCFPGLRVYLEASYDCVTGILVFASFRNYYWLLLTVCPSKMTESFLYRCLRKCSSILFNELLLTGYCTLLEHSYVSRTSS